MRHAAFCHGLKCLSKQGAVEVAGADWLLHVRLRKSLQRCRWKQMLAPGLMAHRFDRLPCNSLTAAIDTFDSVPPASPRGIGNCVVQFVPKNVSEFNVQQNLQVQNVTTAS